MVGTLTILIWLGHEGGFTFLHAATNTSEVFTGTASGITAGNLKLTSGTASSSNTTGDLVVAGGAGITGAVNIGGNTDIDGTLRVTSTSRFDDSIVLQGASKTLQLNNGSGTTKIEFQSTTGNASIGGVTGVTGNFNVNTNKFNVVAASGNTSVAGTLAVTQGTTLTGALDLNNNANISGLVHLESTDQPDIVSGAPHTIQNNDYGALRVDGGGYFAGNVLFDGDIFLNGDFNQQEDATENYGLRNYLSVRYKIRAGSTAAYNPTFSNSNTSNLRVFGGAGVNQNLHVGAVNSGEGFFVGKKNSSDTVKFSVLGASGNTDIQGTLDVAGASEFNGTVDVDADFAVRNGTTDKFFVDNVTGNTTIEGTLLAEGNVNFNGTLDVDADFAVRSGVLDKMTVKSATGNIATAGTLDVNGATEITNTLDVSNAVTFDQTLTVAGQTTINDSLIIQSNNEVLNINNGSGVTKFSVDTDNGNTNIIGTLTVGDATQINDTLGVSDVATFTRNTQQTITGNSITLDGAARFSGGVGISKNLAVGEDMTVYGDFTIKGATTQSGNTGFSGRVTISNTSDATSYTDNTVALVTEGGARVEKNSWVGGDFYVYDSVNNRNAFYVDNSTGDATLHNTLTVGGNLIVNGTTTTVNSTVTTLDDPIITLGGDTAPSSNDAKDRGVEFRYYDGSAQTGFFGLDRSSLEYVFLSDTTNASEVISGTDGALRAGSLNLTGSGTSLDVDADANIDGTLTVDGQIRSQVHLVLLWLFLPLLRSTT